MHLRYWTGYPAGWVDTFQVPGPHETFVGTVGGPVAGPPAGINYLSSRYWDDDTDTWYRTPIGPGEYAVYRVAIWLDSTAPNSAQGATGSDALTFKINFTGMQEEPWDRGRLRQHRQYVTASVLTVSHVLDCRGAEPLSPVA